MSIIENLKENASKIATESGNCVLPSWFLTDLEKQRKNKNNFSYWFPHVEKCSTLSIPESVVIPVPAEISDCFYAYDGFHADNFQEMTLEWVKNKVMPVIPDPVNSPFLFMKNGTFSNKFDSGTCWVQKDPYEIMQKMIHLNYSALMLGADGITEMVFRQAILHNQATCAKIYNGMPLRPEFRVFYDFDQKEVLYAVNYWDWTYCYKDIARDATDRIIYEATYPFIEDFFKTNVDLVKTMVHADMQTVGLKGQWSVDVLYDENTDNYYLIDMALANSSAYWNLK